MHTCSTAELVIWLGSIGGKVTTSWKRSTRGEGGAGRRVGRRRGIAPLLKSRDPHLAGGKNMHFRILKPIKGLL
jgi:hypothetical protein